MVWMPDYWTKFEHFMLILVIALRSDLGVKQTSTLKNIQRFKKIEKNS